MPAPIHCIALQYGTSNIAKEDIISLCIDTSLIVKVLGARVSPPTDLGIA
jgi:hypothetical protein